MRETISINAIGFLCVIVGIFLGGCAKIQAPPGGPADRTPPEVVSVIPEQGAVNVDRTVPIRITFSEPIKKEKFADAVYLSPRIPAEPIIKWENNTVEIGWTDPLSPDLTYLLTIAARVADRRGNRLPEPFILAFSTGAKIDSGMIEGHVLDGNKPGANAQILLFRLPFNSDSTIFGPPDYITEAGADGAYTFSYLPNDEYRAIAIVDRNKNRRLDLGEKAGIGPFDPTLTAQSHRPPGLPLYLQPTDSSRFELLRCGVSPDRIFKIEFSHVVDSLSLATAGWAITGTAESPVPSVVYSDVFGKEQKTVRLLFDRMNTGISYRLAVSGLTDLRGAALDSAYTTCEFFWPSAPDTTRPAVVRSSPANRENLVAGDSPVMLTFSEPVDTGLINGAFFLADSAGVTLRGERLWPDPLHFRFIPSAPLAGGMAYTMALDSGTIVDLAGNIAAERWAARFTSIDIDLYGGIAGSLRIGRDDWLAQPLRLEFKPVGKRRKSILHTLVGAQEFEYPLPEGKYTIGLTVDLNGNRRHDIGLITPFQPAEPRFVFPDTIEVRARFTTENIELTIP